MPADDPGRLSDEEYTDVLAYLLDASSYPSGESELPADKAALDRLVGVLIRVRVDRRPPRPDPTLSPRARRSAHPVFRP